MINTGKLSGLTVFVTGGSRGIGKSIALKVAKDGANVVIAAKTAQPHPKLPGTIYSACEEIEKAGGKALPCLVDVRDEAQVQSAVDEAAKKFGGIDILINNASAIALTPTAETDMKRYDLMHQINTRGTFLASKICLPFLKKSKHAHILSLSPPLNMDPKWFENHVAYTMAKYGMSMCVLGMHAEFRPFNIAVNALWPRTAIHTAAIEMLQGKDSINYSRKPEIMADAAYAILTQDPTKVTGNFYIDEQVLYQNGVKDFDQYCNNLEHKDNLSLDFFLTDEEAKPVIPPSSTTPPANPAPTLGKATAPSGPPKNVTDIFQAIEASLSEDLVAKTKAVYAFHVTGKEEGKWKLSGLTVFITGASRGIGKAIALKVARDGANVVIAAKTAQPHPKLEGTIYTAAKEIEAAGGKCLPCIVDVRDEQQIKAAVEEAVKKFGGIDIVVNNASAISLTPTEDTDMKRYDLMHNINTRGTFLVTKLCLPYLKKSKHPHVLNISPPLNMKPKWFEGFVAYTMAKYGMSMCVLGMHEEFRPFGIAVNALWPKTAIHTAAIEMLSGKESKKFSRKPDIMADSAYQIFIQDPKKVTGNFFIDEYVLLRAGIKDMDQYACDPEFKNVQQVDFFLDDDDKERLSSKL